jgi:hypothetical protein
MMAAAALNVRIPLICLLKGKSKYVRVLTKARIFLIKVK